WVSIRRCTVSGFSDVDRSPDPDRLIRILDEQAVGLAAMKQYVAVTHALRHPVSPVLSLGCGAGHDMSALARLGLACVGIDPSAVMLEAAARASAAPLVGGRGQALPFRDGAFAGCWIERVLMHVHDPAAVVAEAV